MIRCLKVLEKCLNSLVGFWKFFWKLGWAKCPRRVVIKCSTKYNNWRSVSTGDYYGSVVCGPYNDISCMDILYSNYMVLFTLVDFQSQCIGQVSEPVKICLEQVLKKSLNWWMTKEEEPCCWKQSTDTCCVCLCTQAWKDNPGHCTSEWFDRCRQNQECAHSCPGRSHRQLDQGVWEMVCIWTARRVSWDIVVSWFNVFDLSRLTDFVETWKTWQCQAGNLAVVRERSLTYFDLVPRRCSSTQRQLLHESSPCSSILSGTSSILYGKIQGKVKKLINSQESIREKSCQEILFIVELASGATLKACTEWQRWTELNLSSVVLQTVHYNLTDLNCDMSIQFSSVALQGLYVANELTVNFISFQFISQSVHSEFSSFRSMCLCLNS